MRIRFYPTEKTTKTMLEEIARKNEIEYFRFDSYVQIPGDYSTPSRIERDHKIISSVHLDESYFDKDNGRTTVNGINSYVELRNGKKGHLRQLDIDELKGTVEEILAGTRIILKGIWGDFEGNPEGFLIQSSPQNFHFLGGDILNREQFNQWICRAYEHPRESIQKWAELQKARGYSNLRVTDSKFKPYVPRVMYKMQIS
ncbi:MAG: hypothetical protein PVJ67_04550 [Candidatus Pacearchaeota archaeon]|jgi:hypothetical protein